MKLDPDHVHWFQTLFGGLKERGKWEIPRSHLRFERQGDTLVLIEANGIAVSQTTLNEMQLLELGGVAAHCKAAGISVRVDGQSMFVDLTDASDGTIGYTLQFDKIQ